MLSSSKVTPRRLVAVLVAIVLVSFALQAAGHWHSKSYEDQHCRVCHFAHSVAVDLSHGSALPVPGAVVRMAPAASIDPKLELVFHQLSSRAPPA